MFKFLLVPVSWLFGMALAVRHKLFDFGLLKSESFDIPVICVGNLRVGGTGKTPMTDFLISRLARRYNIAVVSRGYMRKTTGFVLATKESTSAEIGDEPKLLKQRYPDQVVAVCEKRAEGIRKVRELYPKTNLIILDDAFQHRYVNASVDILLTEYKSPFHKDRLLPAGRLRDLKSQAKRANFIIVTKVPGDVKPIDMCVAKKEIAPYPYQSLFFTRMVQQMPVQLFPEEKTLFPAELERGASVVAVAAIANPAYFVEMLTRDFKVEERMIFPDHHDYTAEDMARMDALMKRGFNVVTTPKDGVKIMELPWTAAQKEKIFVVPLNIEFVDQVRMKPRYNSYSYPVSGGQRGERSYEEMFVDKLIERIESNSKY